MKTYGRAVLVALTVAMCGIAHVGLEGFQARHLVLEVRQVKAIDECGGNWLTEKGSDEISLGGLAIDPSGRVRKLRTMNAGSFAKDGSTRTYNPPRRIAEFTVRGNTFPQLYQTVLVLVERDPGGGFNKYLDQLLKETQALGTDSAPATEEATFLKASYVPTRSPQVTEVLSAIALQKIGKSVHKMAREEISRRWNSDIFDPVLQAMNVRDANFTPPKGLVTLSYKGHSCNYRVTAGWRIVS